MFLTVTDVLNTVWQYGWKDSENPPKVIRLLENGRISGISHPNEHSWRLCEGHLSFHHIDGRETVKFTEMLFQNETLGLNGSFLLDRNSGIILALRKIQSELRSPVCVDYTESPHVAVNDVRLLICVAFHFRKETIQYLLSIIAGYLSYRVAQIDIIVHTNATGQDLEMLQREVAIYGIDCNDLLQLSVYVKEVAGLQNPWHLPWQHKEEIIDNFLNSNMKYTHFIYSEDDLLLDFNNFLYFLKYKPILQKVGLIPAFCVTECGKDGIVYAKEQFDKIDMITTKIVSVDNVWFLNHNNPYNAFFILDRELGEQYIASDSFDIQRSERKSNWWIAERAAMGLCFENIPKGFSSRYVVPVLKNTYSIPPYALVPHLPNKYANNPDSPIGKIPLNKLFEPVSFLK